MTTTINDILIGTIATFPEGEIRLASMPDGTNLAIYNVGGGMQIPRL